MRYYQPGLAPTLRFVSAGMGEKVRLYDQEYRPSFLSFMASRIDRLEEKKRQLEATIKQVKAKESQKEQAEQHRRKLLFGEAFLKAIESGEVSQAVCDRVLDKYVARSGDRTFLGLSPRSGGN